MEDAIIIKSQFGIREMKVKDSVLNGSWNSLMGYKSENGDKFVGMKLYDIRHTFLQRKYAKTAIGTYIGNRPNKRDATKIPNNIKAIMQTSTFYRQPRFVSRFIMQKNETEYGFYDMYSLLYANGFWGNSETLYLVKVEQTDMPTIDSSGDDYAYDIPRLIINDLYVFHNGSWFPQFGDVLKYTNTNNRAPIANTLKSLCKGETPNDAMDYVIQSIINLSQDWRNGYEDKADILLGYGFGIKSIELIESKTDVKADAKELWEDCVNIDFFASDISHCYCDGCCATHDDRYDNLCEKVYVGDIPDSFAPYICKASLVRYLCVCERCGEAFFCDYEDENNSIFSCPNCFEEAEQYKIRRYHNTPSMKYYDYDEEKRENFVDNSANPNTWGGYGVELEVGNGGEKDSESEQVVKLLNREVYTMHDGSIFRCDDYDGSSAYDHGGFEIITFPHTEKALLNMNWAETFKHLLKHNYRSHDIKSCGLHLHISRTLFKDDDAIKKMMYFYEMNYENVCNFARRYKRDAERWASRYITNNWEIMTPGRVRSILENEFNRYNARHGHDMRYKCVNITNSRTVEVRIMRGTLNLSTFYASLDFLITVAKNANKLTWDEVLSNDINKWLYGLKPETIEYMKTRGCFNHSKKYKSPRNPEELEARDLMSTAGLEATMIVADDVVSNGIRVTQQDISAIESAVQARMEEVERLRAELETRYPFVPNIGEWITVEEEE